MKREFDVVIWGATGFTGKLIVNHFVNVVSVDYPDIKWAVGGRNRDKLVEVVQSSAASFGKTVNAGIFVSEATNQSGIDEMVKSSVVVIAAAGPFTKYGSLVIDACVRFSTHYVDITGEIPWVKMMIDKYHTRAAENKALIVPMCGFDSFPSDVGTLWTAYRMKKEQNKPLRKVRNYVQLKGMSSGGTISSGIVMEREFPGAMKDVFLLGNVTNVVREEDKDIKTALFDENVQTWVAPFAMAGLNSRVVRRSNYLLPQVGSSGYGKDFNYSEVVLAPTKELAEKIAFSSQAPPEVLEKLVAKGKLYKPGEGPSAEIRKKGFFKMLFIGESDDKNAPKLYSSISGGEGGYDTTSILVSECAIWIALKAKKSEITIGGILTPATVFGLDLVDRLTKNGLTFATHANLKDALKLPAQAKL
eukprot:c21277_g5_i1.p1 GENE.c21277_g5_i1~~c21277_g5_i1.p1  ORF type:complete len:437 (-),score=197.06 c21277_g5_i1:73-1323(-)